MSTLSKIAIVMMFLVAVAGSVLAIRQATTEVNWKQAYIEEHVQAQTWQVQTHNVELALLVAQQLGTTRDEASAAENRRLSAALDGKNNELEAANAAAAQKNAQLATALANVLIAEGNLKDALRQKDVLVGQLDKLRADYLQAQDQNRRDAQAIHELTTNVETAQSEVKVIQEELQRREAELKDANDKLVELSRNPTVAGTAGKGVEVVAVAPQKITASVTSVNKNLVGLSVGSADGVKEGMEFYVYRGGSYVAKARIAQVQPSSSAAIVINARRDIQQGDTASTSLGE